MTRILTLSLVSLLNFPKFSEFLIKFVKKFRQIGSIVFHDFTLHASDTLVLHLQLLYDGNISGGTGSYDINEDVKEGLPEV